MSCDQIICSFSKLARGVQDMAVLGEMHHLDSTAFDEMKVNSNLFPLKRDQNKYHKRMKIAEELDTRHQS